MTWETVHLDTFDLINDPASAKVHFLSAICLIQMHLPKVVSWQSNLQLVVALQWALISLLVVYFARHVAFVVGDPAMPVLLGGVSDLLEKQ